MYYCRDHIQFRKNAPHSSPLQSGLVITHRSIRPSHKPTTIGVPYLVPDGAIPYQYITMTPTATGRQIIDDSIAARVGLGFKRGKLPPMSPMPTPTPQPAPAPKEGPSFPSTLDLAGGRRHRWPLRLPPPMPRTRFKDAFLEMHTLRDGKVEPARASL